MTWATPVPLALLSNPVSAPQLHLQLSRFHACILQARLERPLDVFAKHITFKVHRGPESFAAHGGDRRCMRNDGDPEAIREAGDDCEANTVNRNRAFWNNIAHQLFGYVHVVVQGIRLRAHSGDSSHTVNMPAHQMT